MNNMSQDQLLSILLQQAMTNPSAITPGVLQGAGMGDVTQNVNYQDPQVVANGFNNLSSTNAPNPYFAAQAQQAAQAQTQKNQNLVLQQLFSKAKTAFDQQLTSPDMKAKENLALVSQLLSNPNLSEKNKKIANSLMQQSMTQLSGQTPTDGGNPIADAFNPTSDSAVEQANRMHQMNMQKIQEQIALNADPNVLVSGQNPGVARAAPLNKDSVTQVKMPDGSIRTVTYDQAVQLGLPPVQSASSLASTDKTEYFKQQQAGADAEKLLPIVGQLATLGDTYFKGVLAGTGTPGGPTAQKIVGGVASLFSEDSQAIKSAGVGIDQLSSFLFKNAKAIFQGNLSEKELAKMEQMSPSTADTPEVFKAKIDYYNELLGADVNYAKFITDYVTKNGTMVGAKQAFVEQSGTSQPTAEKMYSNGQTSMSLNQLKSFYEQTFNRPAEGAEFEKTLQSYGFKAQ